MYNVNDELCKAGHFLYIMFVRIPASEISTSPQDAPYPEAEPGFKIYRPSSYCSIGWCVCPNSKRSAFFRPRRAHDAVKAHLHAVVVPVRAEDPRAAEVEHEVVGQNGAEIAVAAARCKTPFPG